MTKISTVISDLLEKANIDTTQESLKPVLAIMAEFPDDIATELDKALLTVDSAKSNVEIKTHFIGQFVKSGSSNIEETARTMGLSDDAIKRIAEEKNFIKKATLLTQETEAFYKAKSLEGGKGNKDQEAIYKTEIENLNKKIQQITEDADKKVKDIASDYENKDLKSSVSKEFLSKAWSKAYPENVRGALSETILTEDLNKRGAKIVKDKESGELKLVQAKNPELEYFDSSNKKISFTQLVNEIMTSNNLLDNSGGKAPIVNAPQKTIIAGAPAAQNAPTPGTNKARELLAQSMADQAQNIEQ